MTSALGSAGNQSWLTAGCRVLAWTAEPGEPARVRSRAESTMKSPSGGPFTVRFVQVWSSPAGMEKVMSVFRRESVTVTPEPRENVVAAASVRAPADDKKTVLPTVKAFGEAMSNAPPEESTVAASPMVIEPPVGTRAS